MFTALLISPSADRCQALRTAALESGNVLLGKILEEYPMRFGMAKLLHTMDPELLLMDLQQADVAERCVNEAREFSPKMPILGFTEHPAGAGTDRFVACDRVLPFPPASGELARVVDQVVHECLFGPKENLIVFQPAKAGSGATTVLWNTAVALAETLGKKPMVIEADFRSGVLSYMLDVKVEGCIQEFLKKGGILDGFRLTAQITEMDGVAAVLSNREPLDHTPDWETYARLVDVAASKYDPVMVDLPETYPGEMREIVRRAGKVVLVTTPDIVALKLAERACNELLQNGVAKSRIHVVLNRCEEGDLEPREVEDFMHYSVLHSIPTDHRSLRAAVLRGETISPKSELWKSFQKLAAKLASDSGSPAGSIGSKLRSMFHLEARR